MMEAAEADHEIAYNLKTIRISFKINFFKMNMKVPPAGLLSNICYMCIPKLICIESRMI